MSKSNTYRLRTLVGALSALVFSALTVLSLFTSQAIPTANAATSEYLNFQARLRTSTGSIAPDGNYNIEFKLYDDDIGGNLLWTETRTGTDVVRVVNGYFSVNLGSVTSFPSTIDWSEQHWLTMNIGGIGSPDWDGEMNPRLLLTAVPYAFQADKANTARNVASNNTNSASSHSDNVSIQSGNASGSTSNSGNITIDAGTATGTAGTIYLGSTNAAGLILGRTGLTTLNNGSLTVSQNLTVTGLATFNGDLTVQTGDTLTFNGDAFTDLTGDGLIISGGALQSVLGTEIDLTAEVTGILPVSSGGTGATSFTANGLLYGDGTNAVQSLAAGTTGQCLLGNTGGAPSWGTCGSSTFTLAGTAGIPQTLSSGDTITIAAGTNITTTAGATDTVTVAVVDDPTFSGEVTVDAGLVVGAGQSITLNSESFTDFTGAGLTINSGVLEVILGADIDLTSEVSGILPAANGGTGNGFTAFTGPTTSTKTFTLPNASATILTTNDTVTVTQGGTGATTLAQNGILFGNGTNAIQATASAANSILVTNGSSVPSLSQTLPTAVQGNITTLGTITSGVWNGTALTDTYVSDTLTIGASSTVAWTALNNYPTACSAGQAVTAIGDTLTCAAFASSSGDGDYIQNTTTTQTNANIAVRSTGTTNVTVKLVANTSQTADIIQIRNSADSATVFSVSPSGAVTATSFSGDGASLTSLNATQLTSGTIPSGRVSGSYTGLTGVGTITVGTWNGTELTDAYVSNTLTASILIGSGSTSNAVDLATAEVNGTLGVANGGTGATTLASNGILYGNGTGAIQATTAAANSILITSGANVPSLSQTLPTAVQGNITSLGTITSGVWNGTALTDTYVADTLTINSSSSVAWTALNSYPTACSAGQAVTAVGDTLTCASFATGSGSGNYINNTTTTQTDANIAIRSTGTTNPSIKIVANTSQTADVIQVRNSADNATVFAITPSGTITAGTWNGSTVGVAYGGTGATTFASNGVIYGNGTGAMQATAAGTTGQCLVATTGSAPSWASCSSGGGGIGDTFYLSGTSGSTQTLVNGDTIMIAAGTNITTTAGATDTVTVAVVNNPTFSGLVTANGGLTIEAGDTFTFNSDAFTDLTGTGLTISSGALQTTLGTSIDLTTEVTGILPAANGGTGNGFTAFSGPTTSTKTFTLPNASATILTTNATVTVSQGGTGATTFTPNGLLYGNGTGSIQALSVGTTGQCLLGNTGAAPSWGSCPGDGNTTYSAGNDLDLSGTTFNIEPQLDFVQTINRTGGNLTLQTTTSGNIALNSAGTIELQDNTNVTGTLSVTSTVTTGTTLNIGNTSTQRISMVSGAGNHGFEVGRTDAVASTPFIDFHSGATAVDYDARIIASGGSGANGGGLLTFTAANTNISGNLQTGSTTRLTNAGILQNVTYQGSAIADTYISDTLTVNSSSSVAWTALNSYPTACSAGQAVTAVGDTLTCASFATGSGSGNYINNTTSNQNSANINIQSAGTTNVTLKLRNNASQTADVIQVRNSADSATMFSVSPTGAVTGASFSGNGSALTALNGGNISSGTIANARLTGSGALTVTAGSGLTGGGSTALGGSSTLNIGAGSCISVAADTVGVTASCVNAAQVGGLSSSSFLRSDATSSVTNIANKTQFYSGSAINVATANQATLSLYQPNAGQDAFMQFHVVGDYAAYFGLDGGVNDFVVGGWSMGAAQHRLYHEGNDQALSPTFSSLNVTNTVTANLFSGSGASLTSLNGSNISSGTIANARLTGSGALTVTAGAGMSGGGSVALGSSTTLNIANTGVTAASYGSGSSVATFTVNARGQLTAAGSTSIAIGATQVTSGTLNDARLSSNVMTLNSTQIVTGAKTFNNTLTLGTGLNHYLYSDGKSAGNIFIVSRLSGESNPRFELQSDGKIWWGGGASGGDVSLERTGVNVLALGSNDHLNLPGGELRVGGTAVITSSNLLRVANGTAGVPSMSFSGDTNTGLYSVSGDNLGFSTGGSNRMTLSNSALNVGVPISAITLSVTGGSTLSGGITLNTDQSNDIKFTPASGHLNIVSSNGVIVTLDSDNNSNTGFQVYGNNGNIIMNVTENNASPAGGAVVAYGYLGLGAFHGTGTGNHICYVTGTIVYMTTCTSSRTQKHNINANNKYGLDTIRQLQSVGFNWNADGRRDIGFIAEDVAQLIPETVTYNSDGSVKSFNYDPVVSVLTRAVQQLDVQVQNHHSRLAVVEQALNGQFPNLTVSSSANIGGNLSVGGTATIAKLKVTGNTSLASISLTRITTRGNTPAAVLGSKTGENGSVIISGNDTAGSIAYIAGTENLPEYTLESGEQVALTFNVPYAATPRVVLTPTSEHAAQAKFYIDRSTNGFKLIFIDPPVAGNSYGFDYHVIQ